MPGLAKGDFELTVRGLLGAVVPLSTSSIGRLKAKWQLECDEWKAKDLSMLEIVYQWADGIYVKEGLERDGAAPLVMIGALADGGKAVLARESGYRERKDSWAALPRDQRDSGADGDTAFATGTMLLSRGVELLKQHGIFPSNWSIV